MSPVLSRFEKGLQAIIAYARQHSWRVIGVYVLLGLVFAGGLLQITQVVSIQDQLDPRMQSTQDLKKSKELFGGQSSLGFLVMAPAGGFTAGDLCTVKQGIHALRLRHPEITESISAFDLRRAQVTGDKLHYPTLLPDVCMLPASEKVSLSVLASTPWSHTLTGPATQDLAVNLSLAPLDPPGMFGTFNPGLVEKLLAETKELIPLDLKFTGTSAQEYFTMVGLLEQKWLNFLAIAVIILAFRVVFGSWRAGPLYFLTVGLSATVVYGGMGWAGHAVDPLSVCLFLILSVASLEDFVFVSYEMMSKPKEWMGSFAGVALPCFFTSLSAAAAFLSLTTSDVQSIQRFGMWAALGAMVEWSALFVLLPALLKAFPRLGPWVLPERARFQETPMRWLHKTPPRVFSFLALLFFVGAFYSVKNFRLTQSPAEMFPDDHPFQQTLQFIQKDRGWLAEAGLIFSAQASAELKAKVRQAVLRDSLVGRVETWDQLVSFVAPANASEPTTAMVTREMGMLDFSKRYQASSGEVRDILYLTTVDTSELNRFRREIIKLCPARECWLAGEFVGFADFSEGLISTLFESMLGSVFSVGLLVGLLGIGTGHLRYVPSLVLASFWGPAVMLTAIFLCDITINFVTCIVASTLIGLTGDNAIMFMFQGKSLTEGIEDKGIGSFQTALIMSVVALTFVLSYFEPPRMLGYLLAGGFLCALLGDVWILKGLLPRGKK